MQRAGLSDSPFLTGLCALRAHRSARLPERVWPRLLRSLGVDPAAFSLAAPAGAALIMAEQAGSLWMARDALRLGLIRALTATLGFDPERSGVYQLRGDRITTAGPEGALHRFQLHPGLGAVRLLPSAVVNETKGTSYAALRCDARLVERLGSILDLSGRLVEAGLHGSALSRLLGELVFEPLPAGLRPLVSAGRALEQRQSVADDLAGHDLERLHRLLRACRARLAPDLGWADLWAASNTDFLGVPIRSLDQIFAQMVRAIHDPLALARGLARAVEAPPGALVPLAAVEVDREVRLVQADLERDRLLASTAGGWVELDWAEVRGAAVEARARPAGALEYLLLGAAGYYLLLDPGDPVAPFQAAACRAHERLTGVAFPWLRPTGDGVSADLDALSVAFHPGFARRRQAWVEEYLDA